MNENQELAKNTTASWWDKPVTVTYGQIVTGVVTWGVLDFLSVLWRHL